MFGWYVYYILNRLPWGAQGAVDESSAVEEKVIKLTRTRRALCLIFHAAPHKAPWKPSTTGHQQQLWNN